MILRSVDIFIDFQGSLEELVADLSLLLGIVFEQHKDAYEEWYTAQYDQHVVLSVGTHEYVDDRDVQFSLYRYDMDMWSLGLKTLEEQRYWFGAVPQALYDRLKHQNKYPLMLVDDLQVKIDEFVPHLPPVGIASPQESLLTASPVVMEERGDMGKETRHSEAL